MPWVRFDDMFTIHRKVEALSSDAFRLHVSAIFWCARNLTDGFVPECDLELVTARVKRHGKLAEELVMRDLWITVTDGWEIKDYLKFQPSKEKVLADREAAAERQRNWRVSKKVGRNGSTNAVTNGVSASSPPRPAPLPSGERGGRRTSNDCTLCDHNGLRELSDGRLARCTHIRSVS